MRPKLRISGNACSERAEGSKYGGWGIAELETLKVGMNCEKYSFLIFIQQSMTIEHLLCAGTEQ